MKSAHSKQNASRDHNATSYSTETLYSLRRRQEKGSGRDHNATSYSTETLLSKTKAAAHFDAEIITLRAIALKPRAREESAALYRAEIITLRAIALKHKYLGFQACPGAQQRS